MYRAWEESSLPDEGIPATQPVGSSQSQPTPAALDEVVVVARLVSMDSQVQSIDLVADPAVNLVLGRKASCSVVLEDLTVSAVHCRLYFDDNAPLGSMRPETVRRLAEQQREAKMATTWEPSRSVHVNGEVFYGASHFWIEDLSSNGTYVNMVKLGRNCRARLCHNDVVSLCKPEQKQRTKGTKMTWLFQLNSPMKLDDDYPREIWERYTIKQTLGTGAFSEVKMAVERANEGRLVAIKILDKFKYTGGTRTGDSLAREVEILKKLSHPSIISILDVVDTERMLFIVLELASGGELFDQIARKHRHTEDHARDIFVQLLGAISYLHGKGIVHRDLKPENILLEGDRVKLTDFGFSRVVGEAEMMKTLCGTPMYLAPEVLALSMGTREPEFESAYGYGKAVDMWSLGVILYMLLSGRPPWDDSNFGQLCETVLRGAYSFPIERWDGVSAAAKRLCQRLLTVNPAERITVEEALLHPWITGDMGELDGDEEQQVTLSPPTRKTKKEFAVPLSSASKKARPNPILLHDADEPLLPPSRDNAVLRLIQEREAAAASSPELVRISLSSVETTPMLPPSTPQSSPLDAAAVAAALAADGEFSVGASPIARRLGFETPERK